MYRDLTKRIVAVALSVCMIAGMVDLSGLTVRAADAPWTIRTAEITVNNESSIVYNGQQQRPTVTVVDEDGNTLAQGTDYSLDYGTNINAGTNVGTVTVTNAKDTTGEDKRDKTFTIAPKNITGCQFSAIPLQEIASEGAPVKPSFTVEDTGVPADKQQLRGIELQRDNDPVPAGYDYGYVYHNNTGATTAAQKAYVHIKGNGNYTGTHRIEFEISLLSADKLSFDCSTNAKGYRNGEPIEPPVTNVKYDGTALTIDAEYVVRYDDNCYAGTARVWVEGRGKYNGLKSAEKTFLIRKNISATAGYPEGMLIKAGDIPDQSYQGGQPVEVPGDQIVLYDPDYGMSKALVYGTDFEILSHSSNNTEEGEASVTIGGIGNYSGTRTLPFNIVAAHLDAKWVDTTAADCVYNGKDQFSKVEQAIVVKNGDVTYTKGVDYTVSRVPNDAGIAAGTHRVLVTPTGTGMLTGDPVTAEYKIKPKSLSDGNEISIQVTGYTNDIFDGQAKRPKVLVTYKPAGADAITLTEGQDYATNLEYSNNVNASTLTSKAHVRVLGINNFEGYTDWDWCTFEIKPISLTQQNTTISGFLDGAEYTYTGAAIEPPINVVHSSMGTLTKDKDYTVEYTNNVDVGGQAKVSIKGKGNYAGDFEKSFVITRRNLNDGVTVQAPTSVQFTGQKLLPAITVNYRNITLVENQDYRVTYGDATHNNIDVTGNVVDGVTAGPGFISVEGIGNYEGTVEKTFTIAPRNINSGTLSIKDSNHMPVYDFTNPSETADDHFYPYNGGEVKFSLEIKYTNAEAGMDTALTVGKDFDLEFSRNTNIGTAQVTIRAKGNFTGSKPVSFTIKGDLSDYLKPEGYTAVTIGEEIYTSKPVIPTNVEVVFAGKALTSKDFDVTCENGDNTNAGIATATITGKGNYFGQATPVQFTIRPLNLETDSLPDNNYIINKIKESYTFCDTNWHLEPEPEITHNGTPLTNGSEYNVTYGDNNKAGEKGWMEITGDGMNYEGKHRIEFDILPYDIGAGQEKGNIVVEGIEDVTLEDVVAGSDPNAEVKSGTVVMSNLQVSYTAVDDETKSTPTTVGTRYLEADEYSVFYENNKEIGIAKITITGKGNFGGTIEKTFRIRGDLTGTEMTVADTEYTPAGNTPEPTIVYTYPEGYNDGKSVTLTPDQYTVTYEDNTDAFAKSGVKAKAIVSPVMAEDGVTVAGDFVGTNEAEFTILQRDLSRTIETEGQEKDPSLAVSGLVEEGYEFTGSPIVPELMVTCDEIALNDPNNDYDISAVNNTNVYTFAEAEHGGHGERLMPIVTVSAVKDADGNYNGNYKGEFSMEFKINPRLISADTVRTVLEIGPNPYDDDKVPEVDFTGEEIRFPLNPSDPEDTKNALSVTWKGQDQDTLLVEDEDYIITYENNVGIGEAKIVVTAKQEGNYTGFYERIFKIMASIEVVDQENPPIRYMTLDYDHNVPFGIVDVYPDLIFTDVSAGADKAKILVEGEDFEIIKTEADADPEKGYSKNNRNVASETAEEELRPTVVVRGIGCYRGVVKRFYTITPKDLSTDDGDITIKFIGARNDEEYENAYIYTGEAIEPKVEVYNHGELMEEGTDYTVAGYVNNTAISTEFQQAGVVIQAVEGGNYLNQKIFHFNIIRRPVDTMQVEITSDEQVFSRTPKTPEVAVYYMEDSERVTLTKGTDYDVEYVNNVNAATEFAGENAPAIIITGKGSYGGTLTKKFTIAPETMDESNDDFDITAAGAAYTGEPVTTTLTVKAKDGTVLEEGTDYQVGGYSDNVNAGIGHVAIRGINNYTGGRQVPFTIIAPDVSEDFRVAEIADQPYTGKAIEPEVSVSLAVGETEIPLLPDQYEVTYENNINAGTATAIVKGTGNFGGEKRVNFTITPKSIGTEEGIDAEMLLAAIEDQLYTGKGVTPDVALRYLSQAKREAEEPDDTEGSGDTEEPDDTETTDGLLVLNQDYTLAYTDNVSVGTAGITITGIGNYTGSIQSQFKILGPMNLADVEKIPVQPYTGSPATPKPVVTYAGKLLEEGTDYTLEYKDNVAQGTASIIISGMGWYTGEKTVNFDIARDFSEATLIKGLAAAYTYTGKAIAPTVLVEEHGTILSNGTDYRVTYSNNVNVGLATVTVTGINRYSGTASATFRIVAQNIGRATPSRVADQMYDGKNKTPSVSATSDGITLKSGTDYTVVHLNNKNPGKASVVLKGSGNYTGTLTVNYNIIVPKVTGVKVSSYTSSSIVFSWQRNKVVSGYEIYNSKNKRVARVNKNSTLKATVSKLKANSTDTYRVRAYVNQGQYYYSDFVSIKAGTSTKAPGISSLKSTKSKQVTVKWKKIKGAGKYQVYRSTSKKGKYKKIATTSKTTYTDKKATGGKTYYYKVRTSKKVGTKTYYSKYSSVKSIAAKR